MSIDLEEEDLYDIHSPVGLGDSLGYSDLRLSQRVPVVISYALADLGETDYHFSQEFTARDTREYFRMMKALSGSTINELMENPREHHFYRTDVRGRLREVLMRIDPECLRSNPLIYHFALYTDKRGADRKSGIRSPRIYFMLGLYGVVYILFFDPYHEINPMRVI